MIDKRTLDSVVAAILMVVGLAELWGGFTMDRLEIRQIHPASIPGLVPMFLGAAIFILAVIIFFASRKPSVADKTDPEAVIGLGEIKSFVAVAVLAGIYALGLVGHIHYWFASSLFVFVFIIYAEWDRLVKATWAIRFKTGVFAATVAIVITGAIAYMFEHGFLVRLP